LHGLIREFSGLGVAGTILEQLGRQNVRHQLRLAMQPGRPAVSLPQHLEIIDALCARNANAAETAVRRHIRGLIRALASAGTSMSSSRRRATSSFDGSETSSP
jgi:DNA-binding GntR family transcriptional regulator